MFSVLTACSPQPDVSTTSDESLSWQQQDGTVVVNYFAEWCAPCLRELPELNEFYHEDVVNNDELQLIGVSFDPLTNEQVHQLAERHGIEYPLALSKPAPAFPFERPKMLPATYIIKADGSVEGPLMGEQSLSSLRAAVAD
ncbi:TlpA family protein disulfide reductase [Idiomarina seosinensis]|uniref:TlpA family protein disulfide reductase n=2 Tax=Idiomarina seosinensis TaxID=281739 RepID=A0A432ZIH7_9GAMM|nr:TlpA family protein disulfide reductase [Idiomarina seosinensis]